jgi:hypothetical protein
MCGKAIVRSLLAMGDRTGKVCMRRVVSHLFVLSFLTICAPPASASSLLFRDTEGIDIIPGWNHVAFERDGDMVWESHPGYDYHQYIISGTAYDPYGPRRLVPELNGVQNNHSVGSFLWDSDLAASTPVTRYERIPIPDSLASDMEFEAFLVQGTPYPNLANPFNLSAANQKGANGTFTCVGLVEYCAEQAGYHQGQGFIPNALETIWGISMLTPELLYIAVEDGWMPESHPILGIVDPVDYIVTDPLGRRTGYTQATGLLNEIPGMHYDGHSDFDQLILSNPLPGQYQVDLFGVGSDATVAIGDGSGAGFYYQGFLASGQTVSGTFVVPEPSTIALLGIGAIGLLACWWRKWA